MSAASVDWSAPFTVGDGKSFGDYDNVKLKKGETYTIYEMAAVNKVRIGSCTPTVYELQPPQSVTRASWTDIPVGSTKQARLVWYLLHSIS